MGLFNAVSNRKTQKHQALMRSQGKCPECNGKGFSTTIVAEDIKLYYCRGCRGSGQFNDWGENQSLLTARSQNK